MRENNILRLFKASSILLLAVAVFYACGNDGLDNGEGEYEGSLSLGIITDDSTITKSGETEDFEIIVYRNEEQYARFLKFSDMPQPFKLREGTYELKAIGGNDYGAAYNSPYYIGTAPFTISHNTVTPVDVTCYVANVKVSLNADEEFAAVFSDYSVIITTPYRTVDNPFVVPKSDIGKEDKSVYLKTGDIKLRLNLTKRSNGETYTYGLPIITDVQPRQHYKVTFTSDHPGTTIKVLIEDSLNEEERTIDLTSVYLEKDRPEALAAFDNESPVVVPYRMSDLNSVMVSLRSEAGIKDVTIDIEAPESELSARGIPPQIAFAEMTPEIRSALNEWGLEWSNGVIGENVSHLYFTDMLDNLNLTADDQAANYTFRINVTDRLDNTSDELPVTFGVVPPQFTMPTVTAGDAWATFAYVTAVKEENITTGTLQKMAFQYEISVTGTDEWTEIPMGSAHEYCVESLTPGVSYSVRAKYLRFISDAVTFTTENVVQMPNSQMEDWRKKQVYKGGSALWVNSVDVYEWFVNSESDSEIFWGSNNPRTTSQRSGQSMDYTAYSGTISTDDSRSGKAAKITTMGWGEGTTFISIGYVLKEIDKGLLFTGTCASDGALTPGREFTSRPTKLSFWYKYSPYNNNRYRAYISVQNRNSGTVELGRAEITDGMAQDTYKNVMLDVQYNNEYRHLKATHIEVMFESSKDDVDKDDVARVQGSVGILSGYTDSRYEGSCLKIDDIELIYTK